METLKIEIPKGHEIDSFDQATGVIKFKAKKAKGVMEIKTVADVLADHGISQIQFDTQCLNLSPDEKAYRIIKLLAVSLNEGWVPDWSNENQYKYYPWFEMRGSSGFRFSDSVTWGSYSIVGSRLCFKSSALAQHAGKHFTAVYQQFMVIE